MAKSEKKETAHYAGHRARLRERFVKSGASALPDYELVELLLFNSMPRRDVKPIAKALIKKFGSLGAILDADINEISSVDGMGEVAAINMKVVRETATRMLGQEIMDKPVLGNWQALLDYCRVSMGGSKIEQFRILFLNRKNVLIADELQQSGTVDHTPVYPREVIKRALGLEASALILVHNHPSGDTTPSKPDIEMTMEIQDAGQKLGIALHDHIIVSTNDYTSFKSEGLL